MKLLKLTCIISAVLFLHLSAPAQLPSGETDGEKEKNVKGQNERIVQMLDQAAGESSTLRLAQNRAVVYALSGDLYWKFDEKRSRELFRNSAAEISASNQETEKEKSENPTDFASLFDLRGDIRSEILPLIAKHDAELALELLIQTRPPKLIEAIARSAQPNKGGNDVLGFSPDRLKVSQEIALEQQFALLAADENPDLAIKLIKDSLARGISANVLQLLQKLNLKDEKKALELAGDVIKKLVDSDMTKNDEDMRVALSFLQFATQPAPAETAKAKTFRFSEGHVKDLATKIASSLLQAPRSLALTTTLVQAIPLIEKFAPDKAPLLRQRQSENDASLPPEFKKIQDQVKILDPNATPEDIIAQLPKLQNEFEKALAYQSLTAKIDGIEDDVRARKLIDQIPDEKVRATALEAFEAARIVRTAGAGKLDEARKLIGNLTKKKNQIERLVSLALDFQKKGGEKDVAAARVLMKDARALSVEYPETIDDIGDVMTVVRGYTAIDPDIAFRLFEPIIDKMNEHVQASATLARFNPQSSSFKKGELVLSINGRRSDSPLFLYVAQMKLLGKADLDRMNSLADRFARSDSRAIVRLFVLQGYLQTDIKTEPKILNSGLTIFQP